MYKCAICEKQCKNLQSLSSHITFRHKEFAKEQYYKKEQIKLYNFLEY